MALPASYDVAQLQAAADAIRHHATFKAGWVVLAPLLASFFCLKPVGGPVGAVAVLRLVIAVRAHVIQTRMVSANAL